MLECVAMSHVQADLSRRHRREIDLPDALLVDAVHRLRIGRGDVAVYLLGAAAVPDIDAAVPDETDEPELTTIAVSVIYETWRLSREGEFTKRAKI